VQADASALAPAGRTGDGDVHWAVSGWQHGPQLRRTAVAEQRALAAGEHSREPAPLIRQPRVADGVDAAVDSVEATRLNPSGDGALRDTSRDQLGK